MFDLTLRQHYYDQRMLKRSCELATVVKLNVEELDVLTSEVSLAGQSVDERTADLIKRYDLTHVVVTQGKAGTIIFTPSNRYPGHPGHPCTNRLHKVGVFRAAAGQNQLHRARPTFGGFDNQPAHSLDRRRDRIGAGNFITLNHMFDPLVIKILSPRRPWPRPMKKICLEHPMIHRTDAPALPREMPISVEAFIGKEHTHHRVDVEIAWADVLAGHLMGLASRRQLGDIAHTTQVDDATMFFLVTEQYPISDRRNGCALAAGDQISLAQIVAHRRTQSLNHRPGIEQLPTQMLVGGMTNGLTVGRDEIQSSVLRQILLAQLLHGVGVPLAEPAPGAHKFNRRRTMA